MPSDNTLHCCSQKEAINCNATCQNFPLFALISNAAVINLADFSSLSIPLRDTRFGLKVTICCFRK